VPAGTEHLRATLNGVNGRDFDLYVRQGAAPTDSEFDCRPFRDGHIEVCDFPAPVAGDWYVRVKRFGGSAARYQTTMTLFGESSAIFANGFESGTTSAWSKRVP
jgi:serine protease